MASQKPEQVSARRQELGHEAEEFGHKANEALKETIEEFKERGDDLKATVKEYVNEKPLKALGIALLSGMALALLLKR